MNFLFWNANKQVVDTEIVAMVLDLDVNFLVLAEYEGNVKSLLRLLDSAGVNFNSIQKIACDRITILSDLDPSEIIHCREGTRYTIKEIRIAGAEPLLVALVHLPSKLNRSAESQAVIAGMFKRDLELAETKAGHTRTVAFGDFNMNPFESGMTSVAAMNSVPCLGVATAGKRTFAGEDFTFFYNPSWNLLGDWDGNPGTYFHASPQADSHYWNTLDQVILRPILGPSFDTSSLRVLKAAGATPLVAANGRPSKSDHLPIYFSLAVT